jgi:glycerol-3-phosphate dehydrogenase (NAD(P)+)
MVVEGISATRAIKRLSEKYNVEMPISHQAYEILFNNKDCKTAVYDLMTRSRKHESEDIGW